MKKRPAFLPHFARYMHACVPFALACPLCAQTMAFAVDPTLRFTDDHARGLRTGRKVCVDGRRQGGSYRADAMPSWSKRTGRGKSSKGHSTFSTGPATITAFPWRTWRLLAQICLHGQDKPLPLRWASMISSDKTAHSAPAPRILTPLAG